MASENEASCEGDPNFAVICGFLERFGPSCGLSNIDFLELQEMLENSQEVPPFLIDLHIKLIRKLRKSVNVERWERALINICHKYNYSQDAWEIERFGYKKARIGIKLRVLKNLLEMQFDFNIKFKNEINKMSAAQLRSQPLGRDKSGHAYWFQADDNCQIRVYKEDPDEETWAVVAKDRDELVSLINQLGDNETGIESITNEDSNSLEIEKPILDTGQVDSTSEESSKPSKKSSEEEEEDDENDDDTDTKSTDQKDEQSNISKITDSSNGDNSLESKKDENLTKSDIAAAEKIDNNKEECEKKIDDSKIMKSDNNKIDSNETKMKDADKNIIKKINSIDTKSDSNDNKSNSVDTKNHSIDKKSDSVDKKNNSVDTINSFDKKNDSLAEKPKEIPKFCPKTPKDSDKEERKSNESSNSDMSLDLSKPELKAFIETKAIGLRLKPLTDLLPQPSHEYDNKKPEFSGIKEKYIRSDSISSLISNRKAVDSAGYAEIYRNELKRPGGYDITEPSMLKRPRMDRPTLLKPNTKLQKPYDDYEDDDSEVSEEIEEPLMLVTGRGSGADNNCGNDSPIVGETIEEPIFFVYGIGSGKDCETGNDDKEDTNKSENSINNAKKETIRSPPKKTRWESKPEDEGKSEMNVQKLVDKWENISKNDGEESPTKKQMFFFGPASGFKSPIVSPTKDANMEETKTNEVNSDTTSKVKSFVIDNLLSNDNIVERKESASASAQDNNIKDNKLNYKLTEMNSDGLKMNEVVSKSKKPVLSSKVETKSKSNDVETKKNIIKDESGENVPIVVKSTEIVNLKFKDNLIKPGGSKDDGAQDKEELNQNRTEVKKEEEKKIISDKEIKKIDAIKESQIKESGKKIEESTSKTITEDIANKESAKNTKESEEAVVELKKKITDPISKALDVSKKVERGVQESTKKDMNISQQSEEPSKSTKTANKSKAVTTNTIEEKASTRRTISDKTSKEETSVKIQERKEHTKKNEEVLSIASKKIEESPKEKISIPSKKIEETSKDVAPKKIEDEAKKDDSSNKAFKETKEEPKKLEGISNENVSIVSKKTEDLAKKDVSSNTLKKPEEPKKRGDSSNENISNVRTKKEDTVEEVAKKDASTKTYKKLEEPKKIADTNISILSKKVEDKVETLKKSKEEITPIKKIEETTNASIASKKIEHKVEEIIKKDVSTKTLKKPREETKKLDETSNKNAYISSKKIEELAKKDICSKTSKKSKEEIVDSKKLEETASEATMLSKKVEELTKKDLSIKAIKKPEVNIDTKKLEEKIKNVSSQASMDSKKVEELTKKDLTKAIKKSNEENESSEAPTTSKKVEELTKKDLSIKAIKKSKEENVETKKLEEKVPSEAPMASKKVEELLKKDLSTKAMKKPKEENVETRKIDENVKKHVTKEIEESSSKTIQMKESLKKDVSIKSVKKSPMDEATNEKVSAKIKLSDDDATKEVEEIEKKDVSVKETGKNIDEKQNSGTEFKETKNLNEKLDLAEASVKKTDKPIANKINKSNKKKLNNLKNTKKSDSKSEDSSDKDSEKSTPDGVVSTRRGSLRRAAAQKLEPIKERKTEKDAVAQSENDNKKKKPKQKKIVEDKNTEEANPEVVVTRRGLRSKAPIVTPKKVTKKNLKDEAKKNSKVEESKKAKIEESKNAKIEEKRNSKEDDEISQRNEVKQSEASLSKINLEKLKGLEVAAVNVVKMDEINMASIKKQIEEVKECEAEIKEEEELLDEKLKEVKRISRLPEDDKKPVVEELCVAKKITPCKESADTSSAPQSGKDSSADEASESEGGAKLISNALSFDYIAPSPQPVKRGNRKRGHVSPVPEPIEEETGGKRRKTRGKRTVDVELRRSIEEQKKKEVSSSEEEKSEPQHKTPPKKKGRKKLTEASSDNAMEEAPAPKKKHKKRKTLLGLDISETPTEDLATGVRASRRIAQIKIKEEAERRKLEEITMEDIKEKKRSKKHEDKDFKAEKRKRNKMVISEDDTTTTLENESDEKKKRKRKRKHKKFDELKPWQSSSGSSSDSHHEEEEEDYEEEHDDAPLVFKSDHEFSPESDMESDAEILPLKRARTVKKEDAVEEEVIDNTNCEKCGKSDHPEWILLCDGCDAGWHCSCLRPPLLVIPEGDWYCPPCQHKSLVTHLQEKLSEFDKNIKKHEIEVRRKERLAYVGISLDNVLPTKDHDTLANKLERRKRSSGESESESGSESSSGSTASSSDSDDEPIYQLRQRRQAHSYRFNEYDDLINSAIREEVDEAVVAEAPVVSRGKDMSNIMEAEAAAVTTEEPEGLPPVIPANTDLTANVLPQDDGSEDEIIKPVKKLIGRKKHRKLNSLDVSSGDDQDSDEDFKGSSSEYEEEDDFDEDLGSDSSDYGRKKRGGPVRRSTRARINRYDREFINDDSEDEAPKKKKRSIWDETESEEESDQSWGRRKRRPAPRRPPPTTSRKKKSKKKTKSDDSDIEVFKKKKPKIKYGGLESEEEEIKPRTRGKKINYIDALGTDSEDEVRRRNTVQEEESEDEFILNEEEDLDDGVERDSDDSNDGPILSGVIKSTSKKGVGKGGIKRIKRAQGEIDEALFPPLDDFPPLPEPVQKVEVIPAVLPQAPPMMPQLPPPELINELNPIDEINKNLEAMDEKEMEMMMEEEEYANRQLQMVAEQLEKEKRRRMELEARRMEVIPSIVPPPIPMPSIPHLQPVPISIEEKSLKKRIRKPISSLSSPPPDMCLMESSTPMPISAFNISAEIEKVGPPKEFKEFTELPLMSLNPDGTPKKRRGRGFLGKGKKTLEKEAAAAAAAAGIPGTALSTTSRDSDSSELPMSLMEGSLSSASKTSSPGDSPMHGGKLGVAAAPQPFSQSQPKPSVITRMLQSQPGQASFPVGAMGHKFFADPRPEGPLPPGVPGQGPPFIPGPGGPRGGPPGPGYRPPPGMNPFPPRMGGPGLVPGQPHRLRSPGPQNIPPHVFHGHHPMDPSPSGGGSVTERSSPSQPSPSASPVSSKGDPTPPPPPYIRPPMVRFPPVGSPGMPPRPMAPQHLQTRPPFHPGMPPNFHYGPYPPPPNEEGGEVPFQHPYPEHYPPPDGPPDGPKNYDEENGEFGGLVSYFSSQREDDLDE